MTSGAALAIALLVVIIAPNVTSQPYVQPNVRTARPLGHLETATSQPSSQSRRENFEWNTRRVGNKKVATISIRKDEERDRRSVPLGDVRVPFHKPPTGAEGVERPLHAHRHHHGDDQWGPEGRRGGEGGGKRRGEEEEDYVDDERIGEGWAARGGVDAPPRHLVARTGALQQLQGEVSEEDDEEEDEEDDEGDDEGRPTSLEASSRFHDLLYATGLRADSLVLSNASEAQEQDDERAGRKRKRGKKGKKVKRDRKRRGKDASKESYLLHFRPPSVDSKWRARALSGSEACQYHNLEECYKKVGLVANKTSVVKFCSSYSTSTSRLLLSPLSPPSHSYSPSSFPLHIFPLLLLPLLTLLLLSSPLSLPPLRLFLSPPLLPLSVSPFTHPLSVSPLPSPSPFSPSPSPLALARSPALLPRLPSPHANTHALEHPRRSSLSAWRSSARGCATPTSRRRETWWRSGTGFGTRSGPPTAASFPESSRDERSSSSSSLRSGRLEEREGGRERRRVEEEVPVIAAASALFPKSSRDER
ncbi:hypothetical protein C7M84_020934 [Penaeus vannamei]|uniref:Uncharacterized protein n=1 Tax=Penaeus vannamei TaxID=6689 RepID=A0A3R7PW43_PENVA|nr:hypothetical protein C7M84_020934 [Penaeus vannamei]